MKLFINLLFCICLYSSVNAQTPVVDASIEAGRSALSSGNNLEAYKHFVFAVNGGADAVQLVPLLIESCGDDLDLKTLWSNYLYSEKSDEFGRYKKYSDEKNELLSRQRNAAFRELVRFRKRMAKSKKAANWVMASWAGDLLATMAQLNPALQKLLPPDYTPVLSISGSSQKKVLAAMANEMGIAKKNGERGMALKFARCINGMAAQAEFKDLKGPAPVRISRENKIAQKMLAELRADMLNTVRVYTIEELQDFDIDQQREFTLRHASFENPGVCISPTGLYRVETSCGYNTLLGTATSIELHHQRLLNFYGKDPFNGRQGTVRIVPESFGLESEGAGFYWVGGFQSGDVTTLKFTISTIPSLGRGLTHELTHRFDGATYGGLPAWITEGKAEWASMNYDQMTDENFVDDYVEVDTIQDVYHSGHGNLVKLRELLSGEAEEYRDNYSAGYALYVYLRYWTGFEEGGGALFADKLIPYQNSLKDSKISAVASFEKYFCDGKDGRPATLKEFATDYGKFLTGFYWRNMTDWAKRFAGTSPYTSDRPHPGLIYDEPIWSWARVRTEPWFGQDQARVSALLLQQVNNKHAGLAYQWALVVDEPSDAVLDDFTQLLQETNQQNAAWCLQHWPRYSSPSRDLDREYATSPLAESLPQTMIWLRTLRDLSSEFSEQDYPITAAAFAADYQLYAITFGLNANHPLPSIEFDDLQQSPFVKPATPLHKSGWQEYALSGLDKKRSVGMWYFDDLLGDLHVGRDKARSDTGTMDRSASQPHAVVFADDWQQPGRYKISGKIEQTTTSLHGGIVFSWNRRDRNTRLSFSGGDWLYSVGETDKFESDTGLWWSSSSSFVRGGGGRIISHEELGKTFSFDIIIDGPSAEIYLDGVLTKRMTLRNGRPLCGRIGFFTYTGAMRVIDAKVQRLDRLAYGPHAHAQGWGFNNNLVGAYKLRELEGQPMSGVPLAASGTAVLLFPKTDSAHLSKKLTEFIDSWEIDAPSQGVTVLLPIDFDMSSLKNLKFDTQIVFAQHNKTEDTLEIAKSLEGMPSPILFFADPVGIIQYAKRFRKSRFGLPDDFYSLILEYQDHTRSGLAGAGD